MLALIAAAALTAMRALRQGVLPGIVVGGAQVGGMNEEELRHRLTAVGEQWERATVVLIRPEGAVAEQSRVEATGSDIGYRFDLAATAATVIERGRQANPVAALVDHLRVLVDAIEVDPVLGVEQDRFGAWVERTAQSLSKAPFYGGLRFEGTTVTPLYPRPGVTVPSGVVRQAALHALHTPDADMIRVKGQPAPATTTTDDVDRLALEAERALSGPVRLTRGDRALVFHPRDLASLLRVRTREVGSGVKLDLAVSPRRLQDAVADDAEHLESDPVDARFELSGDSVRVVKSVPGFQFMPRMTARQLLRVAAARGHRAAPLIGRPIRPEFTTRDARRLHISERVSTFTTFHSCCEARVANIHRIADIVDGAIVKPGESFSLNAFVGSRTLAKGFVAAPSIRDGEFVAEVGGGISQFATTFFNAIFFGGYDFLEYQPHSYYISRYPRGREATISTPAPDLRFRNDSDAGIYIDTSYTDTSITVTFYGTKSEEVRAIMGEPFNVKQPTEQCSENKDLGKGETVVIQEGLTGFDVVVKRVLTFPGGREKTEDFFTRYLSQPRIVERRSCDP